MNVACCVGCFGCTKCGCYQDGEEIKYYGAEERAQVNTSQAFDSTPRRRINGSDYKQDQRTIAQEERDNAKLLAGPKG